MRQSTQQKILIVLIVAVLALVLVLLGGGFTCSARAQTVEVIPNATQPSATPAVKIDSAWTPAAVITVATVVIGLLAGTLIPSIMALVKATRTETKTDANEQRLNRQGATQERILNQLPASGGTGDGGGGSRPQ